MAINKLTDVAVRQAKPDTKDFKLSDGGGLHQLVKSNGTKYWRYSYRFGGKQKTLALGNCPEVALSEARIKHFKARKQHDDNKDPGKISKQEKAQQILQEGTLYSSVAREWWEHQRGTWTEDHADRVWRRIRDDVLPELGQRLITEIQPQDIIPVIRKIE